MFVLPSCGASELSILYSLASVGREGGGRGGKGRVKRVRERLEGQGKEREMVQNVLDWNEKRYMGKGRKDS